MCSQPLRQVSHLKADAHRWLRAREAAGQARAAGVLVLRQAHLHARSPQRCLSVRGRGQPGPDREAPCRCAGSQTAAPAPAGLAAQRAGTRASCSGGPGPQRCCHCCASAQLAASSSHPRLRSKAERARVRPGLSQPRGRQRAAKLG